MEEGGEASKGKVKKGRKESKKERKGEEMKKGGEEHVRER